MWPGEAAERRLAMEISTRLSEQLGQYVTLASDEAKLTAANMANVDTPGFHTLGMDFEGAMRSAMARVDTGVPTGAVNVQEVDGLVSRPDGNNVSVDRESMHLAEAQLRFKAGVTLLRLEYQKVMDAIHADK